MNSKLQEIIQEAKSQPVLVRMCRLLEGMLLDFNQKLEEKDARITEFEQIVSKFGKDYSSDMTIVQSKLNDLKERILSTELFNSKDIIIVDNPPECQNGDLLGTIFSFFNCNLQSEFSPCDIKAFQYLGKSRQSSVIVKFVYFAQKSFTLQSEKSLKGIINKTGYPVYLAEGLPPKCWAIQLEAKQMGIKTVTNNCESPV